MSTDKWIEIDQYIQSLFLPPDPVLEAALAAAAEADLPAIQISPAQGQLLAILARALGARRILEIGTLGGFSTIWLGRALPPNGKLITLEANPKHAEVARANLERAGLAKIVEVRLGPALETLAILNAQASDPFDLVFIDADKPNYPEYLRWALRLTRPGSLIIADNVIRKGAILDQDSDDPNVQAMRRFNADLAAEPRLLAIAVQTVGVKGHDGFALALVV